MWGKLSFLFFLLFWTDLFLIVSLSDMILSIPWHSFETILKHEHLLKPVLNLNVSWNLLKPPVKATDAFEGPGRDQG